MFFSSSHEFSTRRFPFYGALLAASLWALVQGADARVGFYSETGLAWVAVSLLLGFVAITQLLQVLNARNSASSTRYWLRLPATVAENVVVRALQVAIAFEIVKLMLRLPYLAPFALLALAAVFVGSAFPDASPRARIGRFLGLALLLIFYVIIGALIINFNSPKPLTDVIVFQRDGSEALLRGTNPYSITFPNVYGDNSRNYGAGMVVNGRLQFGYVYLPLTLLLAVPGFLLGDVRFSHMLAVVLACALICALRDGRVPFLVAAMALFNTPSFAVLANGYTECLMAPLFVFAVFCVLYRPRWLAFALGLWLASKQYVVLSLPLFWLLWPRAKWRSEAHSVLLRAVGWSALWSLPMALWNWPAFLKSALLLQLHQPFRDDSLSYLVLLKRAGFAPPSTIVFALLPLLWFWFLRSAPRENAPTATSSTQLPVLFAAASALFFLMFFAFNKQAFMNYYFLVTVMMACAVAAVAPCENTAVADANATDT